LPACRGGLPGPRQPEFRRDWRIAITTAGLRGRLANSISRRRARRARPAPAGRQVSSPGSLAVSSPGSRAVSTKAHGPSVPRAHGPSVPPAHRPSDSPGPRAISSPGSRAVSLPGSRARLRVVSAPGSRAVRFQVIDNLAEAHGPGLVPAYPVGCLLERLERLRSLSAFLRWATADATTIPAWPGPARLPLRRLAARAGLKSPARGPQSRD